jgi:hypothetical protein
VWLRSGPKVLLWRRFLVPGDRTHPGAVSGGTSRNPPDWSDPAPICNSVAGWQTILIEAVSPSRLA